MATSLRMGQRKGDSMKTDDELRQELFDGIVNRLEERRAQDPTLVVMNRTPTVFSIERRGHLLTFFQADGQVIAKGEIKWAPGPDEDEPHRFRVTRVSPKSSLLRMTKGPEGEVDAIADD